MIKETDIYPNENIIKAALINHYAQVTSKPFVVCNELTISDEYKIVDIVFCKNHLSYAYEIKAWNDDMRRLPAQLDIYCKLFDYIYVVTTENHIKHLQSIPDFVGIVLYSTKTKKVLYKRRARKNHFIDNLFNCSVIKIFIRTDSQNDGVAPGLRPAAALFIVLIPQQSRLLGKRESDIHFWATST